ncbi:MAG: SDR family oxidoreductase [Burkholderiales bacterium]|nr:SDR family oxidoreductase [Burkholderiales bacterium]
MATIQGLDGRVAVVTGGSGGIGAEICSALAQAGATVVFTWRTDGAGAAALVEQLGEGRHEAVRVSVDDSAALQALATGVQARHGRCDILVNCAGMTRFVPHADLDGLDDAIIDEIFRVNWRGSFAAVRAFRPLLKASGKGLVVNISSIAGVTAMGSNVAYCASKAALDSMTKSLARALAPEIRVVSVSPGLVDTEFVKNLDQAWRDEQASRTPLRRLAAPSEVGAAVLAVATTLTYTNGCIIPVDGGRPLG